MRVPAVLTVFLLGLTGCEANAQDAVPDRETQIRQAVLAAPESLRGFAATPRRRVVAEEEFARIEQIAEGYKVVDLGSQNGTQVNGQAITQKVLQPGDRIEIDADDGRLMIGKSGEPETRDTVH